MICFFGGPEGAGKTALMTRYCRIHHLLGGEIWAFPGYEHKNNRGKVVSKLINPTEIMGLVDDMHYIVLVIDEMQNFLNYYAWQNPLVSVLGFGALAQRRKRGFNVLATGPFFEEIPLNLRKMFHIIFNCKDVHWGNHNIPAGEQIRFTETDMRGVLSGTPGRTIPPRIFRPKNYFRFYDTFGLSDPKYQHLRIQIQKDVVKVDSEGNIIPDQNKDIELIYDIVSEFLSTQGEPPIIPKNELNNYIEFRLERQLSYYEISRIGQIMGHRGYGNPKGKGVWQHSPSPSLAGI